MQRPPDVGDDEAEEGTGALVDGDHDADEIDHQLGDGQHVDHQLTKTGVARRRVGAVETPRLGGGDPLFPDADLRDLAEDPLLQVHRNEERVTPQQHLGFAQEEIALFAEGVVQARQDPGLRLRLEVHQGIAADQQVDARDRRILDQVVAPEDDRAA